MMKHPKVRSDGPVLYNSWVDANLAQYLDVKNDICKIRADVSNNIARAASN